MTESVQKRLERKDIGLRIRSIRGARTQKEFAEMTGATQSYISDLERGKCFPSVSFLELLVKISGSSYDWILTGKELKELGPVEPEETTAASGPAPLDMDYNYIQSLIILLRDAPPSEKQRFLRIIVSYLLTYL
jgi:transcriptional regulator with XRE-family HTH domain